MGAFRLALLRLWPGAERAEAASPAQRALTVLHQVFAETGAHITLMGLGEVLLLLPRGLQGEEALRDAARQIHMYLDMTASAILSGPALTAEQALGEYEGCRAASAIFFYPARPPVLGAEAVVFARLPGHFNPQEAAGRYITLFYGQDPLAAEGYLTGLMEECGAATVHPEEARRFFAETARRAEASVRGGAARETPGAARETPLEGETAQGVLYAVNRALQTLLTETEAPQFRQYRRCKKEVREALLFIHFHYPERITLEDVARAVNLSPGYLCRLFKEETGEQMFGFLNAVRMRQAAALFDAGETYVRGVAAAVGISDQFYFTRVFKKFHGVSPSQYVKARRGAEGFG
jgi:two-component system response regulator YesN